MQKDGEKSTSEKRVCGYVRVSSKDQNEERQREALLKEGVSEREIYVDKVSGRNFMRPEYQRMKSNLREGDTVVILDLDRLGRNYDEMASEWKYLTREKKCDIRIINCPLLNTAREEKSLDRLFIADMIFQLLSYVAQKEREEIKIRQREGIEVAKKQGVKFGRKRIPKPDDFDKVYERVLRREMTNRQAMERLGLKANTYYAFVKEFKEEEQNEYDRKQRKRASN